MLASLILASTTLFAASTSIQTKVSIQQAISAAEKAGYTDIRKVEYDHGQWEVKGKNAQDKEFEIKIDAMTGAISKDED